MNSANEASLLQQEVSSLLLKGAIEEVPSSDLNRGFFSWYFLVLKKDGGLRPILDLRRLNYSLYRGKFRMLTLKSIFSQVQEGDWFVTVDLKDAYFHIQVVQRHRKFLRFVFGGKARFPARLAPLAPAEAPGHPDPQLVQVSSFKFYLSHTRLYRDCITSSEMRVISTWMTGSF